MLARAAGSAVRRLAARAEPVGGPLVSNLAGWEANSSASASCRGWRSLSSWTGTTSASTTSAWYPAASDEASRWQRRSASTTRQFTSGASASVAAGTPQEVDLAEDDEGAGRLPEDEATGARVDAASEARSPSPTAPTSPRPVASEMARPLEYMVPVRAYYVGNFIDFHALAKRLPSYPKEFFRESVIVRMTPRRASEDDGAGVGARTETGEGHTLRADADASAAFGDVPASAAESMEAPRYFVVYKYGSVVFFNMGRREREECLKLARAHAKTPLAVPCTDDYRVMVRPKLDGWAQFEADHVVLKRLDLNNISVIGTVLAQTVALEHHELKVDNMIEIFSGLNKTTEETGEMDISKARLFKLVAENNNTLTELVTRMRLLGRSDTAWQYAQYDKVWNGLRADFELEDRFDHLDYKLNLIQTQVKFYLEILQNRKSDTLEWIIIVLISMEICVSLYDMSTKLG